jgi:hypothetical protein
MAPVTDASLRRLRQIYNAAYSAYQNCVLALNEAAALGKPASPELLMNEAAALHALTTARADLLAALASLTNGYPSD